MKKILFLLFLFAQNTFAQNVFQSYEVTQTAEPKGGLVYLKQFIDANLQMPFQARVQRIKGKVFLNFVVETDGSISELKILKGLHPLCDAEAMRLMKLYKAWQPALKDGQVVRQTYSYGLSIPENPVTDYDSTRNSYTMYYDEQLLATNDPSAYRFRQITPLDENGFANSDIIFEKLERTKWTLQSSLKLSVTTLKYKTEDSDSLDAYQIMVRDADWNNYVPVRIFQSNGQLLKSMSYGAKNQLVAQVDYFSSGAVRETMQVAEGFEKKTLWYNNGQIQEIQERDLSNSSSSKVLGLWNKEGEILVKDGNGRGFYANENYKGKKIIEQGDFLNGKKQGQWTGKFVDSTLYYEEFYDNDKFVKGRMIEDGQETNYTELGKQPEFTGGQAGLMVFLGTNIRYPAQASRENISGKVFMSFVVCEDGSLCDFEMLKGVGGGCDEEATRVVKKMSGKWTPGVQRGKKVRVKYNLPVSFVLE